MKILIKDLPILTSEFILFECCTLDLLLSIHCSLSLQNVGRHSQILQLEKGTHWRQWKDILPSVVIELTVAQPYIAIYDTEHIRNLVILHSLVF